MIDGTFTTGASGANYSTFTVNHGIGSLPVSVNAIVNKNGFSTTDSFLVMVNSWSLNIISIQPLAVIKRITNIQLYLQYIFNQTDFNITVYLRDSDGSFINTQIVHIPSEIYVNWTEDSIFIKYVMTHLNLAAS